MSQELDETKNKITKNDLPTIPVPAFVINGEHRVLYWNESVEQLTGLEGQRVIGTTGHREAFYEDHKSTLADLLLDNAEGLHKESQYGHFHDLAIDAEVCRGSAFVSCLGQSGKWLKGEARKIQTEIDGQLQTVVLEVLWDITEEKRKTERLKATEQELSLLFRENPEPQVYLNGEGRIVKANQQFEETFGYDRRKIKGALVDDILVPSERQKEAQRLNNSINEGIVHYESVRTTKDGQRMPVAITSNSIRRGDDLYNIVTYKDITERETIRNKLETLQQVARRMKFASDRDEIYELVMDCTKQVLGYHNCAIMESDKDRLVIAKSRGYKPSVQGKRYSLDGAGITVTSFNENQDIYIPDVNQDDRYIEGTPGVQCEYAIPISIEDQEFGVLNIENDQVDTIPPEDRNLFQFLASEVGAALKGLDRVEQVREVRSKLKDLHQAVDELQQQGTEQEICDTAVEVAQQVLDFDICTLDLVEDDYLVPKAVSEEISVDESKKVPADEGLAGQSLQEGQAKWGDNMQQLPEATPSTTYLKAYISVPIGEIGVFQIASEEAGVFTSEDVELAEILANHLREEIRRVRLEQQLQKQAVRDPLTGLYNRRYFNTTLEEEVERCKRYGHALGFVMMDLNRFKVINDRYSHITGDQVLVEFSELLQENVRESDTVVRYGGDEFLIMFPETGGEAQNTVNRLKAKIEKWNQESDLVDFPVTAAIGTAHWYPEKGGDVQEAIRRADRLLYKEKNRQGRSQ